MADSHHSWGRKIGLAGLRLLILSALTILFTILIYHGMGWQGANGVSDALFLVALGEIVVAGGSVWSSVTSTSGDLAQRVLSGVREKPGKIDHQQTIWDDMLQRQSVAGQALLCGLLTMLVSVAISLLWGG